MKIPHYDRHFYWYLFVVKLAKVSYNILVNEIVCGGGGIAMMSHSINEKEINGDDIKVIHLKLRDVTSCGTTFKSVLGFYRGLLQIFCFLIFN